MNEKVRRLVKFICTEHHVVEPEIIFDSGPPAWYEKGKVHFNMDALYDVEELFYAVVHECGHWLFGRDVRDSTVVSEKDITLFDNKVGQLYYDILKKMSDEDYRDWFGRERSVKDIEEAEQEFVQYTKSD